MRWRCFVPIVLACVLVAAAEAAPAPTLVGIWFGLGEWNDPLIFYLDSFHADGTYNSEFRRCDKAKVVSRQTQSGTWSFANGILTMHNEIVNGAPGLDQHSYTIEQLTDGEVRARLRAPDPDYLFIEKRVPRFEFPACGAAS